MRKREASGQKGFIFSLKKASDEGGLTLKCLAPSHCNCNMVPSLALHLFIHIDRDEESVGS